MMEFKIILSMEFKINIILLINNKINIGQEYLYWHMLLYTKLKFPYFPITFLIFLLLDSEPSIIESHTYRTGNILVT